MKGALTEGESHRADDTHKKNPPVLKMYVCTCQPGSVGWKNPSSGAGSAGPESAAGHQSRLKPTLDILGRVGRQNPV